MTTEARELYCYVTGTEPFATRIEVAKTKVSPLIAIRQIVQDAICKYIEDYCTNGENPFTLEDYGEVANKISNESEIEVLEMSKSEYAREFCNSRGFGFCDTSEELVWRKPINSLEEKGVFFVICEWIWENLEWEDDLESIYLNIHGWRDNVKGGSFNVNDNFKLYDTEERLELSDFILSNSCVFAEVRDTKYNEVVGYICLN